MTLSQPVAIAFHRIHPQTRPGYILLKVANLDQQIDFYQKTLRLHLNWHEGPKAGLDVKRQDLVRLTEPLNGQCYRGVTGIYHFAILFPNRRELARVIARLFAMHWPNSPTDHLLTDISMRRKLPPFRASRKAVILNGFSQLHSLNISSIIDL